MIAYRLATYGTPLRAEVGRRPARYHAGAETSPTQYLCLHPLGPFAELLRVHDLHRPRQVMHVRQRTWAVRLTSEGLREITFQDAERYGVAAGDLVADDHAACQQLAARCRDDGMPGLIVPSAALPGTRNVVLFGARVAVPSLDEPIGAVDVPASITAHAGRPPLGLLPLVRFVGQPHAALAAWKRGAELVFDEPDWELGAED